MKTGGILSLIGLFLGMTGSPQEELSVEERIASWKGERVVLIAEPGKSSLGRGLHKKGDSRTTLPADLYGGKTGTIVEAKYDGFGYNLVIQLDEPAEELVYRAASTRLGIAFRSPWMSAL